MSILATTLVTIALGGPPGEGPPDPDAAADDVLGGEHDASARAPTVVLLVSETPTDNRRARAIEAHLHGLDIDMSTEAAQVDDASSAQDRFAAAQAIAREQQAVGVFWVDATVVGVFDLYLVRPDHEELLRRRVTYDPLAEEAGLESLGVVTRSITSALVDGAPVDMESVPRRAEPEPRPEPVRPPKPQPPPQPQPRERGRAVLGVGYAGTSYAAEIPWQSGLGLSAGWVWPFGLHLGAGYTVYQIARAEHGSARIDVTRHPVDLVAGYTHRYKNLRASGEAALVLDYAVRRAASSDPGLAVLDDRGRMLVALSPRARLGVVALWRLELFVGLGLELWLSNTQYGVQTSAAQTTVVLHPHRVRAWTSAGVAVRI